MRFFLTWLLAFGMVVSPALAGTDGAGDAKNTPSNTTNTTTATEKDKTGDSTAPASKTEAAKPAASSVESELQQLRDLIEAQTKLLQSQSEQLKEQQQRMQVLESEVNSSSARDGFVATTDSVDPDSHTAGVASTPVDGIPTARAGGSPQKQFSAIRPRLRTSAARSTAFPSPVTREARRRNSTPAPVSRAST